MTLARIDFTSCHYLGLSHPSCSLPSWDALSTGQPAVLSEPSVARALARELAALVAAERAVIAASTLHVFRDLFAFLRQRKGGIFLDESVYPVVRWGLQAASTQAARVYNFSHFDAASCRRVVREHVRRGERPVVVSDGCCATCGRVAPLAALHAVVREHGGLLVLDVSQSIGLLGEAPSRQDVYGLGGGGAARHAGVYGEHLITVASLAKAYAAPLAVACGPDSVLGALQHAGSRVHSSPPSLPVVLAARRALEIDRRLGRSLRRRLAARVLRFKHELSTLGIETVGGLSPIQVLEVAPRQAPAAWAERLSRHLQAEGVRGFVLAGQARGPRPAFALSARHSVSDVVTAAHAVARVLGRKDMR